MSQDKPLCLTISGVGDEAWQLIERAFHAKDPLSISGREFIITGSSRQWTGYETGAVTAGMAELVRAKVELAREGLPRIGCIVHIYDPEGELMYGAGESGEVIAHVENTAVVRMSYGLGCFTVKHMRTPEQIAAEERESHVNGMLCYDALGGTRRGLAEALYDAGYRKQES